MSMPEVTYYCFTRTTLFTTMFNICVSLKSIFIPGFILIGGCFRGASNDIGPLLAYLLSGAMSLHYIAIMTSGKLPTLSYLHYFLCVLAIPNRLYSLF